MLIILTIAIAWIIIAASAMYQQFARIAENTYSRGFIDGAQKVLSQEYKRITQEEK